MSAGEPISMRKVSRANDAVLEACREIGKLGVKKSFDCLLNVPRPGQKWDCENGRGTVELWNSGTPSESHSQGHSIIIWNCIHIQFIVEGGARRGIFGYWLRA